MEYAQRSAGMEKFNASYGAAANTILDHLHILYRRRAGVDVQCWDTGEHQNGLVVLLPNGSDDSSRRALTAIDPAGIFAVAAMRAYEAYVADADMDDPKQAKLPTLLQQAGEAAYQLAAPA
ncbi:hypothetical protein [Pseudomonas mosselii]|uniref:hypothetical protein n=1 Tax=Pseudomonas mosselii TaxID=78327 RepID=UPI0021DB2204|nr:hypothetical protein [Pseudomonas mosselii]MCU9527602.1 hypothetical protein [Pseudomonas mosselii]MCU9534915.1 hypothetical protein [Pseudomonas mosselii]MCU9542418.1 hypothetical protein [Pseudomonas mosselii]MCU9546755.1 hypothetical protein [Pseudomonas mosselii]